MSTPLAWTMRMEDGTEHRMSRDALVVSPAIMAADFVDQDPLHLHECLSDWQMMKDDWDNNKDSGKYHYPHTELHAPYPAYLAPKGHGLVVTCAKTNVILTCQNVTRLGFMLAIELNHYTAQVRNIFAQMHEQLMDFVRNGKVDYYSFCVEKNTLEAQFALSFPDIDPTCEDVPSGFIQFKVPGTFPYSKLLDFTRSYKRDANVANTCIVGAHLKMDPFTVEVFDQTPEGLKQMKARVLDLGFTLTDQEHQAWTDYIAQL